MTHPHNFVFKMTFLVFLFDILCLFIFIFNLRREGPETDMFLNFIQLPLPSSRNMYHLLHSDPMPMTSATGRSFCKAEFEETDQTEVQKDLSNSPHPGVVRKFVVDILEKWGIKMVAAILTHIDQHLDEY